MKPKNFMIGDFVRLKSDQWETEEDAQPVRITGVGEPVYPENIPFFLIEGKCNVTYYTKLFEPVPFAEEIFEKNEFKRIDSNDKITYSKNSYVGIDWYDVIVEIGKDAEGIQRWDCVCIKIQKGGANLTLHNQSYFHQLQHALRLVGLTEMADNIKV